MAMFKRYKSYLSPKMVQKEIKTIFFKYKRTYVVYEENGELFISSTKKFIDFFTKPKKIACSKSILKSLISGTDIHASVIPKGYMFTYLSSDGKEEYVETVSQKISEIETSRKSSVNLPKHIVPKFKYLKKFVAYYGDKSIKIMYSDDLKNWIQGEMEFLPRNKYFDKEEIKIGCVERVGKEIILFYYTQRKGVYSIGTMIFDKKDPEKILYRSEKPIFETDDRIKEGDKLIGMLYVDSNLYTYWQTSEGFHVISIPIVFSEVYPKTEKVEQNPILVPSSEEWESEYTFNSAAFEHKGDIHLLYRAIGKNWMSVVGYAITGDGITIRERYSKPAYIHERPKNIIENINTAWSSGGGFGGLGGCEDPRVTKIDGRIYMTYTAFDNYPRVALTSIDVEDLVKKNWKWDAPVIISPPNEVHKNWVIFPKKVNGKYAILHSITPDIEIEYRDNLNFKKGDYIKSSHKPGDVFGHWHTRVRGVGAPPIETKLGWLVFYHAHSKGEYGRYKIGAMLLDKKNPKKVLHRSLKPVIVPDMYYENQGFKPGIVYCCGAVVKENTLYIYYGGADSVLCVAKQNLDTFLEQLVSNKEIKLKKVSLNESKKGSKKPNNKPNKK